MLQNIFANRIKSAVDIGIGISENRHAQFTKPVIPFAIRGLTCRLIMLRAVKLNNEFCLCTVKIHDVPFDHLLAMHHYR